LLQKFSKAVDHSKRPGAQTYKTRDSLAVTNLITNPAIAGHGYLAKVDHFLLLLLTAYKDISVARTAPSVNTNKDPYQNQLTAAIKSPLRSVRVFFGLYLVSIWMKMLKVKPWVKDITTNWSTPFDIHAEGTAYIGLCLGIAAVDVCAFVVPYESRHHIFDEKKLPNGPWAMSFTLSSLLASVATLLIFIGKSASPSPNNPALAQAHRILAIVISIIMLLSWTFLAIGWEVEV
jgi:hypothetical protein